MDSHVKERIVGAAVLVALGVWLIPWVLDGPESEPVAATAPELQLPLPDAISRNRTETVELTGRPSASSPTTGDEASETPADEPPPVVRIAPTVAEEPAAEPPAARAQAAAAPAPTSARPAPQAAPGGTRGAWSVQVGAFGERANAVQLANRVAAYGYEADVSEFQSGGKPMHRVRVEGFATRERAEVASSSLSAHGIPAQVVPAD